ncbi:uncharacterized protein TNCV_1547651 [Trichonephila clavipes]|nr:uncharacterized protein TNCV_1547651 [Trichonephila clavipes]
MMEGVRSSGRVAHLIGHSDCVVRKCWDQWIREMSFTRRPGSGHPLQIIRKKCTRTANCFIGRHPGTSSTFISDRLCLLEPFKGTWLKDIWKRGAHYVSCP